MGWRGRWEAGSGWGTHVNPWLIHVNVWQKPLQYCKVISLQLILKTTTTTTTTTEQQIVTEQQVELPVLYNFPLVILLKIV